MINRIYPLPKYIFLWQVKLIKTGARAKIFIEIIANPEKSPLRDLVIPEPAIECFSYSRTSPKCSKLSFCVYVSKPLLIHFTVLNRCIDWKLKVLHKWSAMLTYCTWRRFIIFSPSKPSDSCNIPPPFFSACVRVCCFITDTTTIYT